jgi:hypothetical protein
MLDALTILNEKKSAALIEDKWNELMRATAQKQPGDFHRYYPRAVLSKCVEEAFEGFKAMQCKPWPGAAEDKVRRTVNVAWERFWSAPASYPAWEKENAKALIPPKA